MPPPSITVTANHPIAETTSNPATHVGTILFLVLLAVGGLYIISQVNTDLTPVKASSVRPFVLLGLALVIALGFEFVNGFHDTANAVATVIYTHSLPPQLTVIWSGVWNFLGVMFASGAVAFTIVSLLPVELILKVSAGAGFAMVFALWARRLSELVAMGTIGTADVFGLPVSTTQVLSSGVAGTMASNRAIPPH